VPGASTAETRYRYAPDVPPDDAMVNDEISGPEPATLRALLATTVIVLPNLCWLYRSDLGQSGGPSPIVTLMVAIPALPLLFLQKIQNAGRALLIGPLAGMGRMEAVGATRGRARVRRR
jgi:hypothetical protein